MKHLLYIVAALGIVLFQTIEAQTWVSLNGPQIASDVKDISVTNSGSTLYVADGSYVLKSASTGSAWSVTTQQYSSPLFVLVKPGDASIVLAAKNGELAYNDQGGGGSSWSAKITEESLTPLRLMAAVNDNTVMLLGRTYVTDNNAIWRSDNSGANWSKVTAFTPATDIHDFAPYPNNTSGHAAGIVWAAGSSDATPSPSYSTTATAEIRGLWKSTNYGQTWPDTKLGGFNVISVAVVSRENPTDYHVYAAVSVSGRDTLMKLTDHSNNNWARVFSGADEIRLVRVNVSTTSIFLATNDGVYRSTDAYSTNGGGTWSKLTSLPVNNVKSIAIGSGSIIFAGTANSLYKSTDNGDNWIDIGKMNVASFEKNGDSLWAVSKDNSFASRTTNAGTSWSNAYIQSVSASFSSQQIYRKPGGGQLFVSGTLDNAAKLYRSTNGGTSYAQITGFSPAAPTAGTFKGAIKKPGTSQEMVLFGEFTVSSAARTMFASTDNGDSWTVATPSWDQSGIAVNDVEYLDISSGRLFAMISNGAVYKSDNNGSTWSSVLSSSGTGNSLAINPNNTSVVYAARSGGLWRSANSGSSWSQVRSDNVLRVVMPYPNSSDILYALTESSGSHVYYTDNGGGSWNEVTGSLTASANNLRAPFNAGFVYAATNRGVYKLDIPPTPPLGIAGSNSSNHPRIDWNANPEADIYAYNVYKSVQHCYPTEEDCYDHPSAPTLIGTTQNTYYIDAAETILPVFGEDGVFRKAWYSVKAVDQGSNLSDASGTAYFLLSGGGGEEDLGKRGHDGNTPTKPTSFELSENYPNPFNPTTTMHYALPYDVHVSLKVFDVLGREVAVLVHQFETAGYKSVSFDASILPSGVYFYRIQAGSFTSIKKMLLAK